MSEYWKKCEDWVLRAIGNNKFADSVTLFGSQKTRLSVLFSFLRPGSFDPSSYIQLPNRRADTPSAFHFLMPLKQISFKWDHWRLSGLRLTQRKGRTGETETKIDLRQPRVHLPRSCDTASEPIVIVCQRPDVIDSRWALRKTSKGGYVSCHRFVYLLVRGRRSEWLEQSSCMHENYSCRRFDNYIIFRTNKEDDNDFNYDDDDNNNNNCGTIRTFS